MNEKFDYGEILFLGKCNNNCYYCLGKEMPKAKLVDNLNTPHDKLKNLDIFLGRLKDGGRNIIYLSSTITEPLLYKDIDSLCDYLISNGFKVGIRTNGLCDNLLELIPKLDAEISISINSLNSSTNKIICGRYEIPNLQKIFSVLKQCNKKCRISIVVNGYNVLEIPSLIDCLQKQNCISYIQLRKRYKYDNVNDEYYDRDAKSFYLIKSILDEYFGDVGRSNFHESIIYNTRVPISLWEDVFKKESLMTLNYFSDGKITTNNLLVPSYEKK